jgi:hypothetical protein
MPAFAGFIGGSYKSSTLQADSEQSINWLPEKIESPGGGTKATHILISKPGLAFFATLAPPLPAPNFYFMQSGGGPF